MIQTPILDELISFRNKNFIKFFMPSHAQLIYKEDFSDTQLNFFQIMKEFENNLFSFDVTEINNFDNLSNPEGIIKKSQNILANSFLANDAHFLVNGSTVGVLAMISCVTKNGDKIIIQKNSHKSVYNACRINNLEIIELDCEENLDFSVNERMDLKYLEKIIQENSDSRAIVITSPDYYGQNQDIEKISKIAHRNGMYLLVDAAHCPHYNYSELFSLFPIKYCDIVVTSFHKTLPCLNQSAVLFTNVNLDKKICDILQKSINLYQTTSPSYLIMSNIELVNNLMMNFGEKLYSELNENIKIFKNKVSNLSTKNIFIDILKNDDFSRIVLTISNIEIESLYNYLKDNMILAEMINEKSIVFICNVFHTKSDFDILYNAIKNFLEDYDLDVSKLNKVDNKNYKDTSVKNKSDILDYLINNIEIKCDNNIYIYPPGTPLITKGEIIEIKHIEKMKKILKNLNIQVIY